MRVAGIEFDPDRGLRIKDAREAAHLSQEDLGEAVGASKWAIGKWEKGNPMQRGYLAKLSAALDVSVQHILDGEEPEDSHEDDDRLGEVERRISRLETRLAQRLDEAERRLGVVEELAEQLAQATALPAPEASRRSRRGEIRSTGDPATD